MGKAEGTTLLLESADRGRALAAKQRHEIHSERQFGRTGRRTIGLHREMACSMKTAIADTGATSCSSGNKFGCQRGGETKGAP